MTQFLIDTNALIDAYDRYYPQGVFDSVWKWMSENKDILITSRVYKELMQAENGLSDWVKDNLKVRKIDEEVAVLEYAEVQEFLNTGNRWTGGGLAEWVETDAKADPWLVAYAKNVNATIVTHEKLVGPDAGSNSTKEPKIPFVAKELGVSTISLWELFKLEAAHF